MNSCVISNSRQSRRTVGFVVLFTAVLILITLIFTPAVTASELYPDRTQTRVFDETGVLTDSTVAHIDEVNRALFAMTGAEVAIVIVKNTGAAPIDDYAVGIFNDWGIGCRERNNGVLLVVSEAKKEFMAIQGSGITDVFSSNKLKSYLNEYLAISYEAGDTDTGVLKTFDVIVSYIESIYAVNTDDYNDDYNPLYGDGDIGGTAAESGVTSDKKSLTDTVFGAVKIVFFVLLLIACIVAIVFIGRSVVMTREEKKRTERRKLERARRGQMTSEFTREFNVPPQYRKSPSVNPNGSVRPMNTGSTASQMKPQNTQVPPKPQNMKSLQNPQNVQKPHNQQFPSNQSAPAQPKRKSTIEGIDTENDGL